MQEVENIYQDAYYRTKNFKGLFIHDISNLFQIISNSIEFCESMLKNEVKTDEILEFFYMIAKQIDRGKKLIRNVRNLSEMEEYEMPLVPVEIFSTLENVFSFTYASFPKKEIEINMYPNHGNLYIMANELLSEVFENIIINSIYYNRNRVVKIEVVASIIEIHHKNYVKIEFKDNGIGIDNNRKQVIFQETHLKNKQSNGMGIGLSLVARVIELYGGEIRVKDHIEGDSTKGSNFIILIPLIKKKKEGNV
ncbi:MAG: sensor histidine kinase [Promethearchaeota archaeon]